jgi:hypothetical protein
LLQRQGEAENAASLESVPGPYTSAMAFYYHLTYIQAEAGAGGAFYYLVVHTIKSLEYIFQVFFRYPYSIIGDTHDNRRKTNFRSISR